MKFAVIAFLGTIALYLVGAFTNSSFDSSQWDGFGKVLLGVAWLVLVGVCVGIASVNGEREPRMREMESRRGPRPEGSGNKVVPLRKR